MYFLFQNIITVFFKYCYYINCYQTIINIYNMVYYYYIYSIITYISLPFRYNYYNFFTLLYSFFVYVSRFFTTLQHRKLPFCNLITSITAQSRRNNALLIILRRIAFCPIIIKRAHVCTFTRYLQLITEVCT